MHLTFGEKVNFFDNNEESYLYARGFMNKNILVNSSTICKTQSEFIVLPKIINQQINNHHISLNNTPVLFGAQVCIKHVQSNCFLKATGQTLENLNGFSLQLSEIFSEDCVFKILPLRTFQHQGQSIALNSIFCIKNQKLHSFLNVDSEPFNIQQPFNKQHYILSQTQYLKACKLSFDKSSLWTFCFKSMQQYSQRKYLNQNDYIYFIHSKDDAILSVNRQNTQIIYQMGLDNDEQVYQNLWEVNYYLDHKTLTEQMRLKHVRSGKYFNDLLDTTPTKITLQPLMEVENRLPPFSIFVNAKKYNRNLAGEDNNFHGFQINTIDKRQVKIILSIKGMQPEIWIPYLINYLKDGNITVKQKILRQFQILTILLNLIKSKKYPQMKKLVYKLLLMICEGNISNKKRCCESNTLDFILSDKQKQDTCELVLELLKQDYDVDIIQTQINPDRIQSFLKQYCLPQNNYKVEHMKILRAFCGTRQKSNKRNQVILFQYFFPIDFKEGVAQNPLTNTVYKKAFEIPQIYKMRFKKNNNKIVFLMFVDGQWKQQSPKEVSKQKLSYYRQYLYLIARCMKQRQTTNIRRFRQEFPLEILCQVLFDMDFYFFKQPVLNVIKTGYIDVDPYMKCEFNFINNESQIAYKGSLNSCLEKDSLLFKVLNFLKAEIVLPPNYQSTYILILLQNIYLTIKQGFWKQMDDILLIKKHFIKIIFEHAPESLDDDKKQIIKKNLTTAKIFAVQIYRCILNVQINVWVSELLFIKDPQILHQTIDKWFYSKNFQWGLDKNLFNLTAETNPKLLQNSLQLFYNLFNVKRQVYIQLEEARQSVISPQLSSPHGDGAFLSIYQNKERRFSDLIKKHKYSDFETISELVSYLIEDYKVVKQQVINPTNFFQPFFVYKKTNKYYQNLACKFGLHNKVISQILKFNINNIRSTNYHIVVQYFFLLIAIIKDNRANKLIVSRERKQLVKFIQVNSLSYICCDFIEEMYKNNKTLITNFREIESVCNIFLKTLSSYKKQTLNFTTCKILNLLQTLITLRHKTIQINKNVIVNQILKKQFASILQLTNNLKERDYTSSTVLYDVILFSLVSSLNQPTLKKKFIQKYELRELDLLLSMIKDSNWVLKSKVRLYVNECNFFTYSEQRIQIMKSTTEDMNKILYAISSKISISESQMFDFERNLRQIIKAFKICLVKINASHQQLSAQQNAMCVKNHERIYYFRSHCSLDLQQDIQIIGKYFNKIWSKITVAGQTLQNQLFYKLLSSINLQTHLYLLQDQAHSIIQTKLIKNNISQNFQGLDESRKSFNIHSLFIKIMEHSNKIQDSQQKQYFNFSHDHIYDLDSSIMDKLVSNILQKNQKDTSIFTDQIKMFITTFLIQSLLQSFRIHKKQIDDNFWFSELEKQTDTNQFRNKQAQFLRYQIPKLVCSFLVEAFQQRYKLYNKVFQLGICLVFDGYTGFQQKFLSVFKSDRKNTIFTSLVTINNETVRNIEFYYLYEGKNIQKQKQIYPGFVKYEMIIDKSEIEDSRCQRKQSCKLVAKLFRFLQLLCQNNNKTMKSYIQNQIDSSLQIKYTSFSFIEQANKTLWKVFSIMKQNLYELKKFYESSKQQKAKLQLFQGFKKQVQQNICMIPLMIFDFLIQVCQTPNQTNQLYLCRTNFFEIIIEIQQIFNDLGFKFVDTFVILEDSILYPTFFLYEKKIVILIRSLLQSNDISILSILQKNFSNRQFQFLLTQSMRYGGVSDKQNLNKMLKQPTMKDQLTNIISLLVIKKILGKQTHSDKINSEAISQLQSRIRSIEVNLYGKTLIVYFPAHPLFDYLPMRTKQWILYQDFQLRTQKLRNMLGLRTLVYEEIEYECKVNREVINEKTIGILFNISLFFSYFIIGLLILFYSVSSRKLKLDIIQTKVIFWASSIQFLFSLGYFILWGMLRAPLTLRRIQRYRQKYHQRVKHNNFKDRLLKDYIPLLKATYLQNINSMQVVIFLFISIMAVVFDPRWFAFNIFYLFTKLDVLKNIFSALTKNFKQMLVVCLFGGAFIFVFALITLNSYLTAIYQNQQIDIDISKQGQHCVSLVSCIISLYTQQIIGQASPSSSQNGYSRFVYDILFIGFFSIFFNNIVSGIMIDKFAELRDRKEKIDNEIRNKCYICGVDKPTLQKMDQIFEVHLSQVHNLWNYYFYLYHLERIKHQNDFTGIEYWIQSKIKVEDISWFPSYIKYNEGNQQRIKALEDKLETLIKVAGKNQIIV